MKRRQMLRLLVGGAALPAWRVLEPVELLAVGERTQAVLAAAPDDAPLLALDEAANRLIVAAAERIIPATDTPGATAARVNRFVDRLLAEWYPPTDRDRFLAGLREFDQACIARHGSAFADRPEAEQVALLTEVDEEVARQRQEASRRQADARPPATDPDEHWFAMLKFMTIWSYCTSEVGATLELRHDPMPGYYDGCAPLTAGDEGA